MADELICDRRKTFSDELWSLTDKFPDVPLADRVQGALAVTLLLHGVPGIIPRGLLAPGGG